LLRLREFRDIADRLARGEHVPRVSLAQFSTAWVTDDAAIAVRDLLDDALLSRLLLEPTATRVCRVLLYDLPERGAPESPDDRHREWVNRLRRDLAYLGASASEPHVDYEIRQLVLGRHGSESRPPPEMAAIGDGGAAFASAWRRKGFALTAGEATVLGPYPDEDPLYYLDLDVTDTDRLEFGGRRRETAPRARRRLNWLRLLRRP
jgi:hypothetical protein